MITWVVRVVEVRDPAQVGVRAAKGVVAAPEGVDDGRGERDSGVAGGTSILREPRYVRTPSRTVPVRDLSGTSDLMETQSRTSRGSDPVSYAYGGRDPVSDVREVSGRGSSPGQFWGRVPISGRVDGLSPGGWVVSGDGRRSRVGLEDGQGGPDPPSERGWRESQDRGWGPVSGLGMPFT